MARRLRTYVHVAGVAYGPDDEVPAAVAKQIGDHAWEDSSGAAQQQSGGESSTRETSTSSKRPAAKRAATRKE